jgi:type II secretory pathway pseudopilin PulG
MKRHASSALGVTLLEIMLVLAIASMIIVMSVRYYQSAGAAQQANTVLQQIQAIQAAADNTAQSTGSYGGATVLLLGPVLPSNSFTLPWGGAITLAPTISTVVFTLNNVPAATCNLLAAKLASQKQYTYSACTVGAVTATWTVTYTPGNG